MVNNLYVNVSVELSLVLKTMVPPYNREGSISAMALQERYIHYGSNLIIAPKAFDFIFVSTLVQSPHLCCLYQGLNHHQKLFEIVHKVHMIHQGPPRFYLHKDVQGRFRAWLLLWPRSRRPEVVTGTMLGGYGQNLLVLGF
jgi:hypothetical protein